MVTGRGHQPQKHCRHGSLHSCEYWLLVYLLRIPCPSYVEALDNAHVTMLAADFVSRVDMRENIFGKFSPVINK